MGPKRDVLNYANSKEGKVRVTAQSAPNMLGSKLQIATRYILRFIAHGVLREEARSVVMLKSSICRVFLLAIVCSAFICQDQVIAAEKTSQPTATKAKVTTQPKYCLVTKGGKSKCVGWIP